MRLAGVTTGITRGFDSRMVVKSYGRDPKVRTVYRLTGVAGPVEFGVHNNNLCNLRRGIMERVYRVERAGGLAPPPRPAPGVVDRVLEDFKRALLEHLEVAAPCTLHEFVQMYAGDRRQKVYQQAVESLMMEDVNTNDARLTTFVKAEKVNLSSKSDPAPRVIQPRQPRYNASVGCFLKRLEKDIYRGIAKVFGGVTVLKGYNSAESGRLLREKWDQFDKPVAVGLDASRFDQHVSPDALRWEHSVYLSLFRDGDRKRLAKLLQMQIRNRGIARASDGHIKYVVEGCRMSGDMNTALGNCLLMCAMVWAYLKESGVRASLANNGDDCVVIMEAKDLKRFQHCGGKCSLSDWFLNMGFTMKVEEPVYVFEQIEFCQTHPLWTPEGYIMCRNAPVAMAKDAHSVLPLEMGNMAKGWATNIGQCGLSMTGGVPVFQEYYLGLIRAGQGVSCGKHPGLESGFARLAAGMARKVVRVHDATRVSFWEAFGMLPSEQVACEERLKAMSLDLSKIHRRDYPGPDFSFSLT